MDNFNPPLTSSIAESLSSDMNTVKISLRSKAEQEIVRDANRKKVMLAIHELNLINGSEENIDGVNIKNLKGLKVLNLKGCNKISDVSLKYGFKFLELRRLLLSNCQQVSLYGMETLVLNCPSIEELDLSDCYNINDKAIEVVTSKLKRLHALNISGCTQLTDHSLDSILVNCKVLQVCTNDSTSNKIKFDLFHFFILDSVGISLPPHVYRYRRSFNDALINTYY